MYNIKLVRLTLKTSKTLGKLTEVTPYNIYFQYIFLKHLLFPIREKITKK